MIDLNELIISNRKNQELTSQLIEWQEKVEDATNRQKEETTFRNNWNHKKLLIKDFQEKLTQYLKTRDDISQLIGQLKGKLLM